MANLIHEFLSCLEAFSLFYLRVNELHFGLETWDPRPIVSELLFFGILNSQL